MTSLHLARGQRSKLSNSHVGLLQSTMKAQFIWQVGSLGPLTCGCIVSGSPCRRCSELPRWKLVPALLPLAWTNHAQVTKKTGQTITCMHLLSICGKSSSWIGMNLHGNKYSKPCLSGNLNTVLESKRLANAREWVAQVHLARMMKTNVDAEPKTKILPAPFATQTTYRPIR